MIINIWRISETDYTEEMPVGLVEIESLAALVEKTDAEIVDNTLICEWGNGEGSDVFGFEIIEDNEPETETIYEITSDLFGDCKPATIEEITSIVETWDADGWQYEVNAQGDELRLYAYRDDEAENGDTPSRYTPWIMITSDYGYIVIGEAIS